MDEKTGMALGILPGSGKWILWDKMTAMGGHIMVETQTYGRNSNFNGKSAILDF